VAADRKTRNPAKIVVGGSCLAVAAAMLWLAVPRAVAGVILLGIENTLVTARRGGTVDAAQVKRLLAAQRSALAWTDRGELWISNGYALLYSTLRSTTNNTQVNREADRVLRRGLARMPVNAEGWYWLAVVRNAEGAKPAAVTSALRMSIFTGPHVPVLAIVRLRLMLRLWAQYVGEERNIVYRQIRYAWSVSPDGVVDIALNSSNDWPIRIALALQPKDLERYETMLRAAKAARAKQPGK
jgi:hypothetical protein